MNRYDLIIAGGGPAGLSTALHVQHAAPELAGRMVVLEKQTYPREKICAGAIGARAFRKLAAIGVTVESPSVDIHALSLRFGDHSLLLPERHAGKVVRRIEFDHALARQARQRGIDIREGVGVTSVERDPDGVRVHLDGGDVLTARAVVGADGVAGAVRRTAGFSRGTLRAQVVELDTEPTEGDPPADALHFDFRFRALNGYAWDFPTLVGGERKVCRGVYLIAAGTHEPVKTWLARYLAERGLDIERYPLKQFAERGFSPREPISRPNVLLVGEAAGIDIATGEGIPQAIAYGSIAGPYLARAFRTGDLSFSDWLRTVITSGVGRRMIVRYSAFKSFYSDERDVMQQIAIKVPRMLHVALRDFAGKPNRPTAYARGLAELAPNLVRHGPGLFVRALRAAR